MATTWHVDARSLWPRNSSDDPKLALGGDHGVPHSGARKGVQEAPYTGRAMEDLHGSKTQVVAADAAGDDEAVTVHGGRMLVTGNGHGWEIGPCTRAGIAAAHRGEYGDGVLDGCRG